MTLSLSWRSPAKVLRLQEPKAKPHSRTLSSCTAFCVFGLFCLAGAILSGKIDLDSTICGENVL